MTGPDQSTPLIVFLAGSRRGEALELHGDVIRIGVGIDMDVRLPTDTSPLPGDHHATLSRRDGAFELVAMPPHDVWVNGEAVRHSNLASGDVIELGGDGAVIRFRLYPAGTKPRRSMSEVFSDCVECAGRATDSRAGQLAVIARRLPVELLTQTSPAVRGVLGLLLLLVVGLTATTWFLAQRTSDLEHRLADLTDGLAVSELVEDNEVNTMIAELQAGLDAATGRLDSLQGQIGALGRAIRLAARSTAFLQGSYGFRDPESGRILRLVTTTDGQVVAGSDGEPRLTLSGDGPPLLALYTGTGFVASGKFLVTNRHVAIPWEYDETARKLVARGFEPELHRFVAFLPGGEAPFDVRLEGASDDADVAILRAALPDSVRPLPLDPRRVAPGDEVAVIGYPLGIRALMARAGSDFVAEVRSAGGGTFWSITEGLASRRLITPLATRGIVGQLNDDYVVYDAETTSGGSGGPVLRADGGVVAVNSAVLPEFGGSNLGVPARLAAELLETLSATPVDP